MQTEGQIEDRRTCTTCGAANRPDVSSCWQCFARFDGALPPAPGSSSIVPPFVPTAAPARTNALGGSMVLRVVVGLLAAFAGYVGVQQFIGSGAVEIPETVAGVERMHGGMAERFEDEMVAEAAKYDLQAEAGAFGASDTPDFLLIVVNGSTWETTDQMFDSFVQGMGQGGMNVDTLRRTGEIDGSAYRCVGAEASGTGVGVCMWRADEHVGIVLDLGSDTRTAEALTQTIYREIVG